MQNLSSKLKFPLSKGNAWVIIMMIIGANQVIGILLTIIVSKLMNSTYVYEGPMYKNNFHPYIQVFCHSNADNQYVHR